MDSLVEGWQKTLKQPSVAIAKLKARFKDIDTQKETESLEKGREYFAGEKGRLLYSSPERWKEMAASLESLHVLRSFDFDANVDYRFLESALDREAVAK